jgi:hypothetical protein
VSYLSHVFGITCETRVTFTPVSVNQIAINVVMQLVGTTSRSLGFALGPAITKATKGFFEELRKECETAAPGASEALVNMAASDSLVASFFNKYHYNFWRPKTAIRAGDTDGNPKTEADPTFLPFIPTP